MGISGVFKRGQKEDKFISLLIEQSEISAAGLRLLEEWVKAPKVESEAVEQMRELSEQVKRATIEQTKGTQHVLEAMDNVTLRVQESSTRAHEIAKFSADLAKEAAFLVELLNQFTVNSDQ